LVHDAELIGALAPVSGFRGRLHGRLHALNEQSVFARYFLS